MSQFNAKYYSAQRSSAIEITISVDKLGVFSSIGNEFLTQSINDITISPRVGNSARYLTLTDGSKLETTDNDCIDALVAEHHGSRNGLAHRLEGSPRFIFLSIVGLIFGVYGFVTYLVPASSAYITNLLPVALDNQLGGELLEQLDEIVFEPSEIAQSRQEHLEQRFFSLVPDTDREFKLRFRSSEILGANAFALPDAQIVFTDQLIELAENDAMIEGIMLHEIGHVVYRHSMQSVVRQAGVSVAIVALTGDVNSAATTLLVLLPIFLIQSQYSRGFEWEADGYALEQMLARGIDTNSFADIMERMSASIVDEEDTTTTDEESATNSEEDASALDYFSTHPATIQRIERFRNAQRQ